MSRGLKFTFLVHAILSFVFGAVMYLKPSILGVLVQDEGDMTRSYGAALLALALSSWLGYRASHSIPSPIMAG